MAYEFDTTEAFKAKLKNFGTAEKKKVRRFLAEFQNGGFQSIDNHIIISHKVRNKNSDNVHTNDPDFVEKVKFALKYSLWHYHAGFYNIDNEYPIDNGYKISDVKDLVSQWLIHYQKISDSFIFLVDIMPHPPMNILEIKPLEKNDLDILFQEKQGSI